MSSTYEELFCLIDADGNRMLDVKEVQAFCDSLPKGPSHVVVSRLFSQADTDASGYVDREEFSALCEGIKLLVKMTESEMVEAFARKELERVFSYMCIKHGGCTMDVSEVTVLLRMINKAFELGMKDGDIKAIISQIIHGGHYSKEEAHDDRVTFSDFERMLHQLNYHNDGRNSHVNVQWHGNPNNAVNPSDVTKKFPLTRIAAVFLAEEVRRKELLQKATSTPPLRDITGSPVFEESLSPYAAAGVNRQSRHDGPNVVRALLSEQERRRKSRGDHGAKNFSGGESDHVRRSEECEKCETLNTQLEEVGGVLEVIKRERDELTQKVIAMESSAVDEVKHMTLVKKLRATLVEKDQEIVEMEVSRNLLDAEKSLLDEKVVELLGEVRGQQQLVEEARAELNSLVQIQDEVKRLQEELTLSRQRLAERDDSADSMEDTIKNLRSMLQQKDQRVTELLSDQNDRSSKSLLAGEALRQQVATLQTELARKNDELVCRDTVIDMERSSLLEREKRLSQREKTIFEKERAVAAYEEEVKEIWSSAIVKAKQELEETADRFGVRELEVVQMEAELKIREEKVDEKIRTAEVVSLPERQRRLRLLQSVEADLMQRERLLRMEESSYVSKLVIQEIEEVKRQRDAARKHNTELTTQVEHLEVKLVEAQRALQHVSKGGISGVEHGAATPCRDSQMASSRQKDRKDLNGVGGSTARVPAAGGVFADAEAKGIFQQPAIRSLYGTKAPSSVRVGDEGGKIDCVNNEEEDRLDDDEHYS